MYMEGCVFFGRRMVTEGNKFRESMTSNEFSKDLKPFRRRMVVINCWISPSLTEGRRIDCYSIHDPSLLTKRSDCKKKITRQNRTCSAKIRERRKKDSNAPGTSRRSHPHCCYRRGKLAPRSNTKSHKSETWNSQDRFARHMMPKWWREQEHPRWK
jgi:hypothetical protein